MQMENSKRDTMERMSNQECIGTLGEKEIYKELGIDKGAMLMEKSKRDTMERIKFSIKNALEHLEKKKSTRIGNWQTCHA